MICPQNQCMACGACVNICSKDAITMQIGEDGYYVPCVNEELCVHCGLCEKTCPQINKRKNSHFVQPDCYAFQADDTVRYNSSSGGAFTVLAKTILGQGGVVFGCAYDEQLIPRHIEIDSLELLPRLQKSKYTQSDTGYTFRRVRELLKQGTKVLFVGVPCQIGGLYAYLNKDDVNLYTVDVMCSGTSAIGVYKKYLSEIEQKYEKKLQGIDFRNKDNGWICGHSTLFFSEGNVVNCPQDPFMQVFITSGMKAHACNECNYAEFPRFGDLTIGDFWNIEKYNKTYTDGKGTSLVTVNSNKGKDLLSQAKETFSINLYEKVDFFFTRGSNWFNKCRPLTKAASRFYDLIKKHTITESLEYVKNDSYDICCLGNWSGYNYGAHLTHFALYQMLTDMGYEVLMLEKPNEPPFPPLPQADLFLDSPYPNYALSPLYDTLYDMKELNDRCHTFITGSDMLWNYDKFGHSMDFYCQSFVSDENKKISFATSFGFPVLPPPSKHLSLMSYLLKRQDCLSTREDFGVQYADEKLHVNVTQVLDPVFLCDQKHYVNMINKVGRKIEEEYIFCYIIKPSSQILSLINSVAEHTGMQVVSIGDALDKNRFMRNAFHFVEGTTVEDWLSLLYYSKLVIADSFHAYAFSVIFDKQVIPVYDSQGYAARAKSLSRSFGLPEPIVFDEQNCSEVTGNIESFLKRAYIDYPMLLPHIESVKEKSREWLLTAIHMPKEHVDNPVNENCLEEYFLDTYLKCKHAVKKSEQDAEAIQEIRMQLENMSNQLLQKQDVKKEGKIKRNLRKAKRSLKEHGFKYTVKKVIANIRN